MKTHRTAAPKNVREPERKAKKDSATPGAPDFAQVLFNLPHPAVLKAATLPTLALAPTSGSAKPTAAAPSTKRAPDERRASAGAPSPTLAPVSSLLTPGPAAATKEIEAPPAAFAAHLEEDPAMRVTVTANTAAMRVQTADGSDLSLFLRIRDGSAQLRIEGAVQQVEQRSDELRVALAHEGITLQRLEVQQTVTAATESSGASLSTDPRDRDRAPPERPELPEAPAPQSAPSSPSPVTRVESGHHVRA